MTQLGLFAAAAPADATPAGRVDRCWTCRGAFADLPRCACCGEPVCGGCADPPGHPGAGDHVRHRAAWLRRRAARTDR